ncbi:MAG TPA: hypothetical protein VJA25_01345 [Dehalococcoidia bacterium]|nr:hypothetical protein [Dehalococcoidia bacterium]
MTALTSTLETWFLPDLGGTIPSRQIVRRYAAALCFTVALGLYVAAPPVSSPLLSLAWAFMLLGAVLGTPTLGERRTFSLLLLVIISAVIAIPISHWFVADPWVLTAIVALSVLPMIAFYLAAEARLILPMLVPVALVHALWVLWQGIEQGAVRATGLTTNANAAAGILLIGAVVVLPNRRLRWLGLPLLMAVPFTGTRGITGLAAVLMVGMALAGLLPWRTLCILVATVFVATVPWWNLIDAGYRWNDVPPPPGQITQHASAIFRTWAPPITANGNEPELIRNALTSLYRRWDGQAVPTILPRGYTEPGTPHNVPWRIAVELGIPSGLAWVYLSVRALRQRSIRDTQWWLLLAIVLMGQLYYWFAWLGLAGALWWMLVRRPENAPRGA